MTVHPHARAWRDRGRRVAGPVGELFVVDEPAVTEEDGPPVLLIHGFPTCSFDWRHIWEELRWSRRMVAPDLPGYGLSDKPDRSYSIEGYADAVVAVSRELELEEVDVVAHDMGDTVLGALLARDLDDELPFQVRRRVVANGSVYIDMAELRWQQQLLLLLPDRSLPFDLPAAMYTRGLAAIYGEDPPPTGELEALWDLFSLAHGSRRLPRLVRYIEERRRQEERWTGALEIHPSPLAIVWGTADPVAVAAIATRLAEARPDAEITWLEGVGHFPMTEAPRRFAEAVLAALRA